MNMTLGIIQKYSEIQKSKMAANMAPVEYWENLFEVVKAIQPLKSNLFGVAQHEYDTWYIPKYSEIQKSKMAANMAPVVYWEY